MTKFITVRYIYVYLKVILKRTKMRLFIIVALLCFLSICSIAKTGKDEDFSEFDDFDQDEFEAGRFINSMGISLINSNNCRKSIIN